MAAEAYQLDGRAHGRGPDGKCRVCGAGSLHPHVPAPVDTPRLRLWECTSLVVTTVHPDGNSSVTMPTETPVNERLIVGLGAFRGGGKHGVRRNLPEQDVDWRISVWEFHYEQGTAIVTKMEVQRG